MKIGILTLPLHTNYGGILQAYALQTVLERMGHEVVVLNKERHLKTNYFRLVFRVIKKMLGYNTFIFYERHTNHAIDIKEKYTSQFVSKHIHSLKFRSFNDIMFEIFDAIVVGSDQVWSSMHGKSFCGSVINAFLPFTEGIKLKRIAYAASFGKDNWEYSEKETEQAKKMLAIFDGISVRESSGVELCARHLDTKAITTLDPTLLLETKDYLHLINQRELNPEKNEMLIYVIDNSKDKSHIVDTVGLSLQLTSNIVNSRAEDCSGEKYELKDMVQPPVESWLKAFWNASFVVTDSFHACVFSILFRKDFIAIGNKERGLARFCDLLSSLGLESRLVLDSSDLTDNLIYSKIDYKQVYEKLDKMRNHSLNFLTKALS